MNHTLVVGAAPDPAAEGFYRRLLADAAHVVAADAAGEWCVGLGRTPDLVVGDFDSARPGAEARLAAAGVEVALFAADKDVTDLDLAVAAARGRFGGPIALTAAFTGRLDHTLAAFGALLRAGAGARAVEPAWTASTCVPEHPLTLAPAAGTLFSVIALGEARGVKVSGGRWPLDDEPLTTLSGRGVSNIAVAGALTVSVVSGTLVVILMEPADGTIY